MVAGVVERIFTAPEGSVSMEQVGEIEAVEGCGLAGDRYCEGTGFWTPFGDVCQITLIEAEGLEYIENELGLSVSNGEHRRNIITRGIDLKELAALPGGRFRVGEVVLQYDRPRPPCKHIQDLTEPGMTRALVGRGGHCARVVTPGLIREGDTVAAVGAGETVRSA